MLKNLWNKLIRLFSKDKNDKTNKENSKINDANITETQEKNTYIDEYEVDKQRNAAVEKKKQFEDIKSDNREIVDSIDHYKEKNRKYWNI